MSPDYSAFPTWCGGSFLGFVPSSNTVTSKSMVGIKPGGSSVFIGYQVDEFSCTKWAEHFIAQSHIHPGFMAKVSTLSHFLAKTQYKDSSFLDQAVADFKHGLQSILTDSVKTLELNASF